MKIQQFRDAYNAQPFLPFVIRLADGRKLPVPSREFILAAPSGRTAAVYQPNDTLNIIDILLVTNLEFRPPSNGKRKRGKK